MRRIKTPKAPVIPETIKQSQAKVLGSVFPQGLVAKVAMPTSDPMNQTERRYANLLESRRVAGEILRWDYEPVKLRLADLTFYTPDFRVILDDCTEEFHEVKGGFIRDDAMVKIKVAAETHPYSFVMAQYQAKTWKYRRFEVAKR